MSNVRSRLNVELTVFAEIHCNIVLKIVNLFERVSLDLMKALNYIMEHLTGRPQGPSLTSFSFCSGIPFPFAAGDSFRASLARGVAAPSFFTSPSCSQ